MQLLFAGFRKKKGILPVSTKGNAAQNPPVAGRLPVALLWMKISRCGQISTIFGNPKFSQNHSQRTKFGKSELEQVETDKSSKKEPVFTVKDWARLNT